MERIKVSFKRDLKYFLLGYLVCCLALFLTDKKSIALPLLLTVLTMFVFIMIVNYLRFSIVAFSNEGICLNSFSGARKETPWDSVQIELIKKNRDQIDIDIKTPGEKKLTVINYVTQDSLIDLTRKYCPKNHELYKIIEEYAKERNLPF